MTEWFGCSPICLQQWEWNCNGVSSLSEPHIPSSGWIPPADSESIHDSLFSLESLSITLLAKAPFSHIDGAAAVAFFSEDWFGSPKNSNMYQGLCLFTCPQAYTQTAVFPLQCPLPHICFSLLVWCLLAPPQLWDV